MAEIDFKLLAGAGSRSFKAGETIFRTGDAASELFVVQSGAVEIRIGDRVIETVPENGIFGEMALIDDAPRSATAVARCEAGAGRAEAISLSGQPDALFRAQRDACVGTPVAHGEQPELTGERRGVTSISRRA